MQIDSNATSDYEHERALLSLAEGKKERRMEKRPDGLSPGPHPFGKRMKVPGDFLKARHTHTLSHRRGSEGAGSSTV
jgi:hypothetical protein